MTARDPLAFELPATERTQIVQAAAQAAMVGFPLADYDVMRGERDVAA